MAKIIPVSPREQQIVHSLGDDAWEVIEVRNQVVCLNNQSGILISKLGHTRWVKSSQVS